MVLSTRRRLVGVGDGQRAAKPKLSLFKPNQGVGVIKKQGGAQAAQDTVYFKRKLKFPQAKSACVITFGVKQQQINSPSQLGTKTIPSFY